MNAFHGCMSPVVRSVGTGPPPEDIHPAAGDRRPHAQGHEPCARPRPLSRATSPAVHRATHALWSTDATVRSEKPLSRHEPHPSPDGRYAPSGRGRSPSGALSPGDEAEGGPRPVKGPGRSLEGAGLRTEGAHRRAGRFPRPADSISARAGRCLSSLIGVSSWLPKDLALTREAHAVATV
jgi:hypothetical protein